jgi:MerR family transcriptional regulator, redox-sensitive transcriptional activator SoxR
MQPRLTIGEVSARAGVARSALRFYESRGLIAADRTVGGQRRYRRDVLRRVAFIRAAQRVGLSLSEITTALSDLPMGRAPTRSDWGRLARHWQGRLDDQIRLLTELRNDLTSCIGCGCLSLRACALSNPDDLAEQLGSGPRFHLGEGQPAPAR